MEKNDQDNGDKMDSDLKNFEAPEVADTVTNERTGLIRLKPTELLMPDPSDNHELIDMEIDEDQNIVIMPEYEYEYSDLSSPSAGYISPTGPEDMFLVSDPSFEDTDDPNSARSQYDKEWYDDDDVPNSYEASRVQSQQTSPLSENKIRKRRHRSRSSPRPEKASTTSISDLEECTVPYDTSSRAYIQVNDIGPLDLQKVIKKLNQSSPDIETDYFVPPGEDYQVHYIMQREIYDQLQESNMDQDLIKIYLVFDAGNPISETFSLEDKIIDLIKFVYMHYQSVNEKNLEYKIPIFSIKSPVRRNLSKHSVHTTFRKLEIQSETTIHVSLIPKLDKNMRPIKLD